MAKVEQKVEELRGYIGQIGQSVEGVRSDIADLQSTAEANATEIQSLKDAVLAAQGGELSEADLARFDTLIEETKTMAQTAADLDAQLPKVVTPPTE